MASIISTNTIFHYTNSIANLESILKNNFYPHFCLEDFFGTIMNSPDLEKAIPMVCFCDIPLSQISKHVQSYGEYAIGMSKEWAILNKINPVLYTYADSHFASALKKFLVFIQRKSRGVQIRKDLLNYIGPAVQFVKPYEGKLWKNGKWSENKIRFYDEREWRYVPQLEGEFTHVFLGLKTKEYEIDLKHFNEVIESNENLRLRFEPNDVKYVIVSKESEILKMLDILVELKRPKFTYADVQVLTTRIISMENIRETF